MNIRDVTLHQVSVPLTKNTSKTKKLYLLDFPPSRPFDRVVPYSAGTGPPVSPPVLCMVGAGGGTFCGKVHALSGIRNSETLRQTVNLVD